MTLLTAQSGAILLEDPLMTKFEKSIRSAFTRHVWLNYLRVYMDHYMMFSWSELIVSRPQDIEADLEHFVIYMQDRRKVKPQTVSNYLVALRHFYDKVAKIKVIDWDSVRSYLGEFTKAVQDRPYTREEIQESIRKSDVRKRIPIVLEGSCAVRVGAMTGLKIKDFQARKHPQSLEKMYKIIIYRGSKYQYTTFSHPEATAFIDDYWNYRLEKGEVCPHHKTEHYHDGVKFSKDDTHLNPEAPAIREEFDKKDHFAIMHPRHIAYSTLTHLIDDAFVDSGVRKRLSARQGGSSKERKEVMMSHGLRKFCRQQMRRAGLDPIIIEYLLGHDSGNPRAGVTKLMMTYDPDDENELFEQYCKAVDNLTIFDENRLKYQVSKLQEELSQSATKDMVAELMQKQQMMLEENAKLKKDQEKFKQLVLQAIRDSGNRGEGVPVMNPEDEQ